MTSATFDLHAAEPVRQGEPVQLTVTGDIDASNAPEFAGKVEHALRDRTAVLDISAVRFIDSAGYSTLHRLHDTGRVAVLLRPESLLCRSATLMGLPYHSDAHTAVRSTHRPV